MTLVNKSVKIGKGEYNFINEDEWYIVIYEYISNASSYLIIKTPDGVLKHVSAKYVVEISPEPENTIEKRLESIENLLRTQSVIGKKVLFQKEILDNLTWIKVDCEGIIIDKFLVDGVNKYLVSDNENTYYINCNLIKFI